MDRYRTAIRTRQMSYRTEQAYAAWVVRFIRYHGMRHPREMGAEEVGAFLSWLAVAREVSASTQNQALSALLFLYRHVLGTDTDTCSARSWASWMRSRERGLQGASRSR